LEKSSPRFHLIPRLLISLNVSALVVVKDTQEIELVMYGHSVGENKTTRSSSGGLNGGSTGT